MDMANLVMPPTHKQRSNLVVEAVDATTLPSLEFNSSTWFSATIQQLCSLP